MIYLVLGTPDSGKSQKAEDLVQEISGDGPKYYVATMIPFGEEGKKRIAKHRAMREGKGFETIESPVRVHEIAEKISDPGHATCLLECMSNLIGNEMHDPSNLNKKSDIELSDYIIDSVMKLSERVKDMVIVANSFPLEDEGYDDDTRRYVGLVDMVNERLKQRVDKVYEITK